MARANETPADDMDGMAGMLPEEDVVLEAATREEVEELRAQVSQLEAGQGRMLSILESMAPEKAPPPGPPQPPKAVELPEGFTRFRSPIKDFTTFASKGGSYFDQNQGQLITIPAKPIHFSNGVYDANPEETAHLRSLITGNDHHVVEDPMATPIGSVQVTDGPRTSTEAQAPQLTARL